LVIKYLVFSRLFGTNAKLKPIQKQHALNPQPGNKSFRQWVVFRKRPERIEQIEGLFCRSQRGGFPEVGNLLPENIWPILPSPKEINVVQYRYTPWKQV